MQHITRSVGVCQTCKFLVRLKYLWNDFKFCTLVTHLKYAVRLTNIPSSGRDHHHMISLNLCNTR